PSPLRLHPAHPPRISPVWVVCVVPPSPPRRARRRASFPGVVEPPSRGVAAIHHHADAKRTSKAGKQASKPRSPREPHPRGAPHTNGPPHGPSPTHKVS